MDPNTFRVAFDLVNDGVDVPILGTDPAIQQFLRPLPEPWWMFRRLRLLCEGNLSTT